MNKKEFLKQLEQLLLDIPESERREAVEYYENYFEDAGPEMEQKIIEELGSPQEVAASIKKNLFGEEEDFVKRENPGRPYQTQENKTTRNLLITVIVILTFPIWIGIAGAAFGLLEGGIACIFAIAVTGIVLVGVFLVVGIILAVIGIANLFTGFPAGGLVLLAVGMFLLAIAVLGTAAIVWFTGRVLPWTIRAIVRLCKKPFQKRGAVI